MATNICAYKMASTPSYFPFHFLAKSRRQAAEIARRSSAHLRARPLDSDVDGEQSLSPPSLFSSSSPGAPLTSFVCFISQQIELPFIKPKHPAALHVSSRTTTPYQDAIDNADQALESVVSL
jgi:hypothetical protein